MHTRHACRLPYNGMLLLRLSHPSLIHGAQSILTACKKIKQYDTRFTHRLGEENLPKFTGETRHSCRLSCVLADFIAFAFKLTRKCFSRAESHNVEYLIDWSELDYSKALSLIGTCRALAKSLIASGYKDWVRYVFFLCVTFVNYPPTSSQFINIWKPLSRFRRRSDRLRYPPSLTSRAKANSNTAKFCTWIVLLRRKKR